MLPGSAESILEAPWIAWIAVAQVFDSTNNQAILEYKGC
jgi:hypothetical protein